MKVGDVVQYYGNPTTSFQWYGMVKSRTVDGVCEIMWFGNSAQKLIGVMDFIPEFRLRKVNDR